MNDTYIAPYVAALDKARTMSYQEQIDFVKTYKWIATNHWDNWFHPILYWNYSLCGAIQETILRPFNIKYQKTM